MDPASISGALTSLKAARDVARAMLDLKVSAEVQLKVIELQELILSAQSDALDAQQRIRELEQRLAEINDWENERTRYVLQDLGKGRYVYSLRDDSDSGEPQHYLCPQCFQDKIKSILQRSDTGSVNTLRCTRCGNKIHVDKGGGGNREVVWAI